MTNDQQGNRLGQPQVPSRRSRRSAVALAALFWGAYFVILVVMGWAKAVFSERWQPLFWGLTSSALIFMATLAFLWREQWTLRQVGLNAERASLVRLLLGLGVGGLVFGLNILAVGLLTSELHFERVVMPSPSALLLLLSGIVATCCMEELGFRAYSLRILLKGFNAWPAQLIVALMFGLCHIAFGWSWGTVLGGVIPSALLFGMAAVATGGLAVPLGIHTGLNIAQWSIGKDGLWRAVVDPQAAEGVSRTASVTGILITILAAFLFWLRTPKDTRMPAQGVQAPNKAAEPAPGTVMPRVDEG